MLSAPGQPVTVRTAGLQDWDRTGQSLGRGLGAALEGAVDMMALQKVNQAGEMAAFSERLRDISAEARDELQDAVIRDWDYSWNEAVAPRVAEAVQELSVASREGGRELARAYCAQASVEAKRDRELQRLERARGQWQKRVDDAVSAGQEEQAARWLEAGRGVFVPENEMEKRGEELRSRACLSRWESRLQSAPLQALAELAVSGKTKRSLPTGKGEREQLESRQERARRDVRRELARVFSEAVLAGDEPDAAALDLAVKAGIVEPMPEKGTHTPPSPSELSAWRRWVDAREDGEEGEQEARLVVAVAPLPAVERRRLLKRLERTAGVPAADRRALEHQLFSLYNSGTFGCPGDAEAQQTLLSLQDEGASLLAEQGAEAVSAWVEGQRSGAGRWVCFEDAPAVES